jgi:hypothetical protein
MLSALATKSGLGRSERLLWGEHFRELNFCFWAGCASLVEPLLLTEAVWKRAEPKRECGPVLRSAMAEQVGTVKD